MGRCAARVSFEFKLAKLAQWGRVVARLGSNVEADALIKLGFQS